MNSDGRIRYLAEGEQPEPGEIRLPDIGEDRFEEAERFKALLLEQVSKMKEVDLRASDEGWTDRRARRATRKVSAFERSLRAAVR